MNVTAYCVHLGSTATAATAAPAISLTDALLLLVFAGLLLVAYHLHRIGRQLAALAVQPAASVERPAPRVAPVALAPVPVGAGEGPPPEIQAAIAAAVYVLLGESARVVAITEGAETSQVWSLEGRRQIFASHRVR